MELLRDLLPQAKSVAILTSYNPKLQSDLNKLAVTSSLNGIRVVVQDVRTEQDIDAAFASIVQQRIEALVVQNDAYLNSRRDQIIALAARHRISAIYAYREHIQAGGLISYGTDVIEMYRPAGVYVGQILRGVKPVELPILQPTKFELGVNLRTAKALGLTVPPLLVARADEVIE